MTQAQPPSRLTRFRLFWEALDSVLVKRGLPPPSFEQATDWFGLELTPNEVADIIHSGTARRAQARPGPAGHGKARYDPWDDHYFEERLTREDDQ